MNVITHGEDARLYALRRRIEAARGAAAQALSRYREIHLCAIPTRALPDLPEESAGGRLLVGYGMPPACHAIAARCIDLSLDEIFLEENARLTALGAIGYLLTHHTRALCDLTVGVVGYGRIGRRLVRYLTFLGASVTVLSSRACTLPSGAQLHTVRWDTPPSRDEFAELDVLINTAPAQNFLSACNCPMVLDLASGAPIPESVAHEKLPSLPARLYSESAGFTCYRAIIRKLLER